MVESAWGGTSLDANLASMTNLAYTLKDQNHHDEAVEFDDFLPWN
jgi:hypothetical protein